MPPSRSYLAPSLFAAGLAWLCCCAGELKDPDSFRAALAGEGGEGGEAGSGGLSGNSGQSGASQAGAGSGGSGGSAGAAQAGSAGAGAGAGGAGAGGAGAGGAGTAGAGAGGAGAGGAGAGGAGAGGAGAGGAGAGGAGAGGACNAPVDVFQAHCFNCHSAAQKQGKLDLESAGLVERLVGVKGSTCTDALLIDPAAPEKSALYDKTAPTPACAGDPMPKNGAPLTGSQRACLLDWITSVATP